MKHILQKPRRLSEYFLILANFIPLLGVIFLQWDVFTLVSSYWFESAVIGFYTLLKIAMARGLKIGDSAEIPQKEIPQGPIAWFLKIYVCVFFTIHYSGFMFGHWVFLNALFHQGSWRYPVNPEWIFLGALIVSHGVSFVTRYLGNREYQRVSPFEMMFKPYGRIVLMHMTVIFGGIAFQTFGMPLALLVIMILIKTIVDLASHQKEHLPFELS